uniref:ECR1_N domain-containing protein n=1 Tax=Soboliphyme baturini TaxID=241478 RepID=A0A183IKU5_9BILA
MKTSSVAILVLLSVLCSGENGRRSSSLTLEEKVSNLQEWISRRPVIHLNHEKFRQYVRMSPRNYSVVLMLTALSAKQNCYHCLYVVVDLMAKDEFEIVANSYRYAYLHAKELYFTLADFDEAPEVFRALSIRSVPVIIHFPPQGSRKTPNTMDISRMGFGAEVIAKWILDRTEISIRVLRPPNYSGPAALLLLLILIGGLMYVKRNNLDFLRNTTAWGILALCIIFAFLSGQMWNHIRGPPFIHRNERTGRLNYFSSSSQMQFIVETYVVMLICKYRHGCFSLTCFLDAAITVGFIMMNEAVDMKGDPMRKRGTDVVAIIGLLLVAFFFSFLLSLFRSKYHGYPYSEEDSFKKCMCIPVYWNGRSFYTSAQIVFNESLGERLCKNDPDYKAGVGTYVTHGCIYASLAGFVNITKDENGVVRIGFVLCHRHFQRSAGQSKDEQPERLHSIPWSCGDLQGGRVVVSRRRYVVMFDVTVVTSRFIKCDILCVERSILPHTFSGLLRCSYIFVSSSLWDYFRQLSANDVQSFLLTTAENPLGVVFGYCKEGHKMTPTSGTALHCKRCACSFKRKLAMIPQNESNDTKTIDQDSKPPSMTLN